MAKKKPADKKVVCPRVHFHRPGVFCKACNSTPSSKGE